MTDFADELAGEDFAGAPDVLRHLGNGEYELFDAADNLVAVCESGDVIYSEPYRYVCRGGRWVRMEPPLV